MSDKRESFKKSLGITEYPWSSDDEQNDIAQPMSSIQSMQSEPTQVHHTVEIPSTSAAGPSGSQVMARNWSDADQARQDRQSYWSYLSNPMLSGSRPRPVAHTQRPTSPAYCEGVTNRWARRRDMKRYVALMKLKNNRITQHLLTALGESHSSGSGLYSSPARPSLSADVLTRPGHVFAARTNRLADLSAAEAGPSSLSERNLAENADGDATDAPEPINVDHSEDDEESPDQSSESILQQLQADDNAQARQEHAEAVARHGAGAEAAPDLPAAHAADPPPQEAENAADSSLDGSEPNSVKEFNMNLLRLLECPVCLEWMEPPMSQCRRGHLVCGRCRARLAACPVCRTSFSSVRNRAMEWVAEMLRYPCRHGCGREVRLRRRGTHEASCPARRYRCIAPECARQDPMPRDALTRHAQSKHLSMLKIGRKHKFALKLNADRRENWLVMCLNEMFHLKIDVDIRTWTVVVYLAYIGPKCNSNNYIYEVTVLGQDNLRKLSYTRQTHCDLESTSLNVGRQDCFHLSIDQALNFLRVKNRNCLTDQLLHFDIELNRVEVAQEAE